MASVKTLHEIVTPEKVYPVDTIIHDMPKALIDEMRPIGAVVDVSSETDAVEVSTKAVKKG